MSARRALHWVFKVGDRKETMKFYREVLGMKILRHEEFEKGCEAMCNGPYDGKWSKTMVGYGPEDNHFVVELTYNYNISGYKLGNDFRGITIRSKEAIQRAAKVGWPTTKEGDKVRVEAPGGYPFYLLDEEQPKDADPVSDVSISVTSLSGSIKYWVDLLGLTLLHKTDNGAKLTYHGSRTTLSLVQTDHVDHAKASGRIAFSIPAEDLPGLEEKMKNSGTTILTPLLSLDTPGKATVQVVILADPDGYEICFVGDAAFRELSQVDPQGGSLLDAAMDADKSNEWFAKKGKTKVVDEA